MGGGKGVRVTGTFRFNFLGWGGQGVRVGTGRWGLLGLTS